MLSIDVCGDRDSSRYCRTYDVKFLVKVYVMKPQSTSSQVVFDAEGFGIPY